jgi:hypothetical protein
MARLKIKKILFIGSGGHFREQFQWFRDFVVKEKIKNYNIIGIIDDVNYKLNFDKYSGLKIFRSKDIKYSSDKHLILSIGDPRFPKPLLTPFASLGVRGALEGGVWGTVGSLVRK